MKITNIFKDKCRVVEKTLLSNKLQRDVTVYSVQYKWLFFGWYDLKTYYIKDDALKDYYNAVAPITKVITDSTNVLIPTKQGNYHPLILHDDNGNRILSIQSEPYEEIILNGKVITLQQLTEILSQIK